jgi:hypothetical protein
MKVSELIAQLQQQPPDAEIEVESVIYPEEDETLEVALVETFKNEETGLYTVIWIQPKR